MRERKFSLMRLMMSPSALSRLARDDIIWSDAMSSSMAFRRISSPRSLSTASLFAHTATLSLSLCMPLAAVAMLKYAATQNANAARLLFEVRLMVCPVSSLMAGASMSIQGVMNTRLSDKVGLIASNAYVQGSAFLLSLIALIFVKNLSLKGFGEVNKWYLLGGVFGLIITITVMLSVKNLSPVVAISTILVAQLLCAAIIDAFGLMDSEKIAFTWNKYVGLLAMIAGVVLLKWKV